jgi:hypothetical protein
MDPMLESWIDYEKWRQALSHSDSVTVSIAWRVVQLNSWLTRRWELLAAQDHACIR